MATVGFYQDGRINYEEFATMMRKGTHDAELNQR